MGSAAAAASISENQYTTKTFRLVPISPHALFNYMRSISMKFIVRPSGHHVIILNMVSDSFCCVRCVRCVSCHLSCDAHYGLAVFRFFRDWKWYFKLSIDYALILLITILFLFGCFFSSLCFFRSLRPPLLLPLHLFLSFSFHTQNRSMIRKKNAAVWFYIKRRATNSKTVFFFINYSRVANAYGTAPPQKFNSKKTRNRTKSE